MSVRCPGRDLEMDEEDLAGQRDHMEEHHPEIIAERLAWLVKAAAAAGDDAQEWRRRSAALDWDGRPYPSPYRGSDGWWDGVVGAP